MGASRCGSDAETNLRPAVVDDAEAIRAIYNQEVELSAATMDLRPRSLAEQQAWILDRDGAFGAIVAEVGGEVAGFGSLSPYRDRPAYSATVEDSVYVSAAARGLGLGRVLLRGLIDIATRRGFHTILAHIASDQEASIALHEACGFAKVGVQRQVGRKFNRWVDVVIMQHMIDPDAHSGPATRPHRG